MRKRKNRRRRKKDEEMTYSGLKILIMILLESIPGSNWEILI